MRPLRVGNIGCVEDDFVSGPVMAQAEITIAASEREVWVVLADIDGWPTWNPAVREATLR